MSMLHIDWSSLIIQVSGNLFSSLVILLGAWVARLFTFHLIEVAIHRVDDSDPETTSSLEKRAQTLGGVAKSAINVVLGVVVVMMVLSEWGMNIAPILTGAGILGLAIGFGAQSLVKDVVTGFFILLENQFNVGDTVEIAGFKGEVLEMNLRTTVLRGDNGQIHIIPNSQIAAVSKR